MSAALSIRIAAESDIDALVPIAESREADRQFLVDRFAYLDGHRGNIWILLRADEEFVGWGILHTQTDPHYNYPELEDLYIRLDCRNRSYGTFLVARIEEVARKRGLKGISLGVNPDDNPDARRFYERLGYRHDGGEKRLDGIYGEYEDWTIGMEKKL
ncbi:MAG: GNAT family N-acetyltransferase [Gemmatimonadetes bacterium]|jgi:GNAT superfamily N-acetyltransferase|nr:GNAT family N-acetyltransferase [Gemmatimonadota bacterium]